VPPCLFVFRFQEVRIGLSTVSQNLVKYVCILHVVRLYCCSVYTLHCFLTFDFSFRVPLYPHYQSQCVRTRMLSTPARRVVNIIPHSIWQYHTASNIIMSPSNSEHRATSSSSSAKRKRDETEGNAVADHKTDTKAPKCMSLSIYINTRHLFVIAESKVSVSSFTDFNRTFVISLPDLRETRSRR
jgi:hypothetical protein